jgi:hypothetical protein
LPLEKQLVGEEFSLEKSMGEAAFSTTCLNFSSVAGYSLAYVAFTVLLQ